VAHKGILDLSSKIVCSWDFYVSLLSIFCT